MKTFFAVLLLAAVAYLVITSQPGEPASADIPIGVPDDPMPRASSEKQRIAPPVNSSNKRNQRKNERDVLPAPTVKPDTPRPAPVPFREGNTLYI